MKSEYKTELWKFITSTEAEISYRFVRHCGLAVSAPAWDGTGCEFDSWQCRIYILGVLWVHMAWHKNCVEKKEESATAEEVSRFQFGCFQNKWWWWSMAKNVPDIVMMNGYSRPRWVLETTDYRHPSRPSQLQSINSNHQISCKISFLIRIQTKTYIYFLKK